jgi:hypothetical protein
MKKGLLIAFAVLLFAINVSAGDNPYIGIFATDVAETDAPHSICGISPPLNETFVMWIWILPSSRGMNAAEFRLRLPLNVTNDPIWGTEEEPVGELMNPDITLALGGLTAGTSIAFNGCQNGWTWTHKRAYFAKTNTLARFFYIDIHPTALGINVASCELGNPLEPATKLTNLYLYTPCVYATKASTWGAIKSLF